MNLSDTHRVHKREVAICLFWLTVLWLPGCAEEQTTDTSESAASAPMTTTSTGPQAAETGAQTAGTPSTVALSPAPDTIGPLSAPTTLLVLGDSISAAYGIQREQGWVALLEAQVKLLGGEHRVINASISGDTTGGGRARLPTALAEHQPDLVIIELGGNDGLRGYPVKRIRENLSAIIEAAHTADVQVLLVGMQIPPNYGPRYSRDFAQTFIALAEEFQLNLVPNFLEEAALAGDLMQADGIHPTASAQPLLLKAMWPAIAAFLESRR